MTQEEFFKRFTYSVSADRIGGGGFGTVYKAKDHVLHRTVAIKVSEVKTTADGQKTFSLKDEFDALKHLSKHPNIANYEELYTFEDHRGICDYAVMQYYPDGNLSNAIKQGLTAQQKEDIATQLLEGIAFLHKNKVVHRDLKPGNILIMKDDDGIIPIITDFGLSKAANMGDGSMFSNSFGGGTQRYSSPEQLQGKPLRLNTDLWSYGSILYELFTGEQLFTAGSGSANSAQADLEIYNKIIHGDVEKLSKMPEKWRKVAERCLVVDADKRAKNEEELFGILGMVQNNELVADTGKNTSSFENGYSQSTTDTEGTLVIKKSQPKEKTQQPSINAATGSALSNDKPKDKKRLWIGSVAFVIVALVMLLAWGKKVDKGYVSEKAEEVNTIPVHNVNVTKSTNGDIEFTINDVSFIMKLVESGTFQMGSNDKDAENDEKPLHSVTLSSYYLGETEVTQSLWQAVMADNPSSIKGNDLPVDRVSYNDIVNGFIPKLNSLTNENFRLPTEAEWEFAARGGNKSRGYKYSGSSQPNDVAWFTYNSEGKTHSVKSKLPNEAGLYDMSGSVWEWCQDYYGEYNNSSQTNPTGPSSGLYRVVRGGDWTVNELGCRVSGRYYYSPDYPIINFGFRLVLPVRTDNMGSLPLPQPNESFCSPSIDEPHQPLQASNGTSNGHEYVNLGLPSGTLWATCNVGASKPEDYGNYYAWGEKTTKSNYDWGSYKYFNFNGNYYKLTKYCNDSSFGDNGFTDNLTTLQASDDPAATWGSGWHTPDNKQWEELLKNTTNKWTTLKGVSGRLFTAMNGQTLFLPAAGSRHESKLIEAGSYGGYWSRSLSTPPSWARFFGFGSDAYGMDYGMHDIGERIYGQSIRPVREK